jgi:mannan endo-1,4-beta-mannosidase
MRRTTALLAAVCSVAVVTAALPGPVANAGAAGSILLGVHTPYATATSMLPAIKEWEGKRNAFADTEEGWHPEGTLNQSGNKDETLTFQHIKDIWSAGSIPLLSWYPLGSQPSEDLSVARGGYDPYLISFCNKLRTWLSGPDGIYGTGDDRRLLMRFAPEANGDWHTYSPLWHPKGTPPSDGITEKENALKYVAMWQHVHDVFTGSGLDPTHVAWIFAVAQTDSYFQDNNGNKVAVMEQLFPGDAFTDWVGVDGYNQGGLGINPTEHWKSPSAVFDPMLARLRAVSVRPTAVSEVGTTRIQDDGSSSDAAKTQWLSDYGDWVAGSGVRMAMYWDDDYSTTDLKPDYPVFGGTVGPNSHVYAGRTYLSYDEYAAVVSRPEFLGADEANLRITTNAAFLGVDALPG